MYNFLNFSRVDVSLHVNLYPIYLFRCHSVISMILQSQKEDVNAKTALSNKEAQVCCLALLHLGTVSRGMVMLYQCSCGSVY